MKTHDLAKQLTTLARALKNLPNVEVDNLSSAVSIRPAMTDSSMAMGLTTLTALSDIDKNQWQSFIQEHKLPIEIRPRDAARDIIGKVLAHLQSDKEARARIARAGRDQPSQTSPELQKALQFLLGN